MDLSTSLDQITIPALHVSGWYDTYLNGTIAGFRALTAHAGTQHARDNQYLFAGPWVHIPWGNRIGTQNFGPEALLDTDDLLLRWFNHWLKDSGEFSEEPKIKHFALNQNEWHNASTWPTESSLNLYLHSEGRANSSKGNGTLSAEAPTNDEASDILSVDPEVPVIAPGGIASSSGCFNQAAAQQGNNVLVYTSEPFDAPLHLFGTPSVTLQASTSAAHADLVAKLTCVRPNGDADFICIGIARSSFLFEHYAPDTPHTWCFDLEPTSWFFQPGERLRLEVSGSSYPLFDRNPHTAVKPSHADSWNWKRSTHILHHSAEFLSALHLPVAP